MSKQNEKIISIVLYEYTQSQNVNLKDLCEKLTKEGMNIKYSSLYLYYTGAVTPPYEVWVELNRRLGLKYSGQELLNIFDKTKEILKNDNSENKRTYDMNLRIKPELVNYDFKGNVDKLKTTIEKRADELFDDDQLAKKFKINGARKTAAYITYLIQKDLEENGHVKR